MIGIDTNVLVRFVVRDDVDQAQRATALFGSLTGGRRGFLSLVALVETYWVLTRSYRFSREQVLDVVARLCDASELVLQEPLVVRRALEEAYRGVDLADALIAEAGRAAGCSTTVTFRRRAARHAGMEPL